MDYKCRERIFMKQLYTRWGRALDKNCVLQEHPRPLLKRDSYHNLNGYWDYAITRKFRKPETYDGRILVPFSPESVLSGVRRQLLPEEYLWYRIQDDRLHIDWDKLDSGMRLILHFGAVDQACRVYVNGKEAARHTGGYLPFSKDITEYLRKESNEIVVAVKDLSDTSYHAKGKQKLKKGGMFYTAQSGIWQTVWTEYVPKLHITELITEPDLGRRLVRIFVRSDAAMPVNIRIHPPCIHQSEKERIDLSPMHQSEEEQIDLSPMHQSEEERIDLSPMYQSEEEQAVPFRMYQSEREQERPPSIYQVKEAQAQAAVMSETEGMSNEYMEIPLPDVRPWTCEQPWLYDFTVTMGEDTAESYFALRTFTVEPDGEGIPRICMNGEVQFQNGVLDQGYWPDGLYTAPSDEALIFDILEMKKSGFNMIRKHIKIEPHRWYYHCDRLGMVVWQDMVNGGTYYKHWFVTYAATLISWKKWKMADIYPHLLSRTHKEGRLEFVREMKESIRILRGHPSIAAWVIFNEGWGQFQTEDMTRIARECDPTRLIDQASGWFDQKGGDLQSVHNYFFKLDFTAEKERATVLSEFGGYSLRIPDHSASKKLYGYGIQKTRESLNAAYKKQMRKVQEQISRGLCASVYTQLSDVEEEMNGIFTYDREVRKILP